MTVDSPTAPMREFLLWLARHPRTYADAIEAWGSHCPRFTIWEDAIASGLVEVDHRPGAPIDTSPVRLTSRATALLPD